MRKQYFFRPSRRGYFAWDVDRLIALSEGLPPRQVAIGAIAELDAPFALEGSAEVLTYRDVAEHARLIQEADLRFPIILAADGRVMDGMHRVMKALIEGRPTVSAVTFAEDPPPDHVDVFPDQLPYQEQRGWP